MHLKVNTCHLYPRNDLFPILGLILTTFWPSRISIQDFIADSTLFCFFCFSYFSMDKIKASKLGNWKLLFPTHPPLVFIHFLGLAYYFHLLDNSLMLLPTREVLDRFSKCFIHLWCLLYFGKLAFLSFMSCFHTILFSYEGCNIYVH